jgi:glycosyltransferase involved in cell wall biosynthesis
MSSALRDHRAEAGPDRGRRVLWTSPYFPWPASNGGKTRQYGLLRGMAERGHRITLLALAREMPAPAEIAHLKGFLERVVAVPRRARTSPATLLAAATSLSRPAVATVNGCNPDYAKRFAALLAAGPWDAVQVEHSYGFEPLERALATARIPWLITEHNVESRLVPLQYARLPAALRGLAVLDQQRGERWERRVLRQADCVVAVTPEDAAEFRALGARSTAVVPNCIDVAAFAAGRPCPDARRLGFLGNYDYAPNRDAVEWLAEVIMPLVWQAEPQARLRICGSAMPAAWAARWPEPRLEWTGYTPTVQAAHAGTSGFIAPLRAGGGSKLKVLEAMASGLPVIGTPQAVSGLAVTAGEEFLGGTARAEDLAAAAVAALRDPALAAQVGERGRRYVARGHDWSTAAADLEALWMRVAAPVVAHV